MALSEGCSNIPASLTAAASPSNLLVVGLCLLMSVVGYARLRSGLGGYMDRIERLSDLPVQMRVAVWLAPLIPGGSAAFVALFVAQIFALVALKNECQPWVNFAQGAGLVSAAAFVYAVLNLISPGKGSGMPPWWWRLRGKENVNGNSTP